MPLLPRRAVPLVVAACLGALGGGCGSRARTRPNVLLVTLDTVRADRIGCYGHRGAETPALDSLARDGVRFASAFSPSPLTLPSHATLLTGLLPQAHGLRDNGMVSADLGAPTLAERLSSDGYDTAAFVSAFVLNRVFGLDRGFAAYDDGPPEETELTGLFRREAPGSERVEAAIRWLSGRRPGEGGEARPFFLWVHLFDAHAPHVAPPGFEKRYAASPYDGEIAYLDLQVGRLLHLLDARGLADRTLVVVAADHGESLGEHGEATHGAFLYDATLRVPLLLRSPGRLPRGAVRDEPVSLTDVSPTVLALAGLPPGPATHGVDLFGPPADPRRPLLAETIQGERHFGWAPLAAVRREGWKYVDAPRPELYDLGADPGETRDRFAESPRLARVLSDLLAAETARVTRARGASDRAADDAEVLARLQSLGYVSGPRAGQESAGRIDPKDGIRQRAPVDQAYDVLTRGDAASAEALFRAALRVVPENRETWLGLGKTLELLERFTDAEVAYREALARDPRGVLVLARLFALAERRGDVPSQLDYARRLAELLPRHEPSQRRLAEARRRAEASRPATVAR